MRYLSSEWLAAADAAVATMTPFEQRLDIRYTVTDGPGGLHRHRVVLGPDRVRFVPEQAVADPPSGPGEPDGQEADTTLPEPPSTVATGNEVIFTLSWTTAASIAQGLTTARRAFLAGELRLGGDPRVLLAAREQLEELDDRLAPLRAATDY